MPRRATGTSQSEVSQQSAQPRLVGASFDTPDSVQVGESVTVPVEVTNKATILNPDDKDACSPTGGGRGYQLRTGLELTSAPGRDTVSVASRSLAERVTRPGNGGGGSPGPSTAQILCVPNTFGSRTATFEIPAQSSPGTIRGRVAVLGFTSDNLVYEESFTIQVEGQNNGRNNNGGSNNGGNNNRRNSGSNNGGNNNGGNNSRRDTGSDNSDDSGDEEDPFAGTPLEDLSREERLAVGAGGAALLIALSGRR